MEKLIEELNSLVDYCYWKTEESDGETASDAYDDVADRLLEIIKKIKQ